MLVLALSPQLDGIFIYYLFLQRLLYELLKRLDAEIKHEVCHWAAYYVSISFQILFIVPLVDFPSPLECSAQAAYIQPPLIRANSDPVALHS